MRTLPVAFVISEWSIIVTFCSESSSFSALALCLNFTVLLPHLSQTQGKVILVVCLKTTTPSCWVLSNTDILLCTTRCLAGTRNLHWSGQKTTSKCSREYMTFDIGTRVWTVYYLFLNRCAAVHEVAKSRTRLSG